MKRWLAILMLAVLTNVTRGWSEEFFARVVKVDAGDRLDVKHEGHIYHVRLFDVRCPEGQKGAKATAFTKTLANLQSVRVRMIGTTTAEDTSLAEVHFINGNSLSDVLVKAGLAKTTSQELADSQL